MADFWGSDARQDGPPQQASEPSAGNAGRDHDLEMAQKESAIRERRIAASTAFSAMEAARAEAYSAAYRAAFEAAFAAECPQEGA